MRLPFLPALPFFCLLGCSIAFGGDEAALSAGTEVPALKVAAVAGPVTNEEKDFAADRGARPTLYFFVQADKWDRPVVRLLSALDRHLAKERSDVLIIAVWLTDDVAKSKAYLPRAQESLKLSQTVWSVFPGEKSGPTGWNLDIADNVTVVVAHEGQAVASFAYGSVNDTLAREILGKLPEKKSNE